MSHATPGAREHKPHVLPIKVYAGVWAALLVLTVITVRVSYFDFGFLNLLVAMVVATLKAGLVVLFFMHLKYDEKFNVIVFAGCLAFLFTFFVLTLADTTERGKVDSLEARNIRMVPARPDLEPGAAHDTSGSVGAAHDTAGTSGAAPAETTGTAPPTSDPGH